MENKSHLVTSNDEITKQSKIVDDLTRAAEEANKVVTSARAALFYADNRAEQAFKSKCGAVHALQVLLDKAAIELWNKQHGLSA